MFVGVLRGGTWLIFGAEYAMRRSLAAYLHKLGRDVLGHVTGDAIVDRLRTLSLTQWERATLGLVASKAFRTIEGWRFLGRRREVGVVAGSTPHGSLAQTVALTGDHLIGPFFEIPTKQKFGFEDGFGAKKLYSGAVILKAFPRHRNTRLRQLMTVHARLICALIGQVLRVHNRKYRSPHSSQEALFAL
jgi:hypothetical protein